MNGGVALRALCGSTGTRLDQLLGAGLEPIAPLRPGGAPAERLVAAIGSAEGAPGESAAGLPEGAALPEALAARLRERGGELSWGEPVRVSTLAELLQRCRARGRSSVAVVRADPELVTAMQVGAWFDAPWRTRLLRRLAVRTGGRLPAALALRSPRMLAAAADSAFWAGVREAASAAEWRRLTASSYAVLVYHRFAGEGKPGQERIDVSPARFHRQIRALRIAGFRPIAAEELLGFHAEPALSLPRRRLAITVDDGTADCVEPLTRHADWQPQLFVCTAEVGGAAHWLDGEPLAGWEDLHRLRDGGVAVGSHGRRHRRLPGLGGGVREDLERSLQDLEARLGAPVPDPRLPARRP